MRKIISMIALISTVAYADYSCKITLTKNGEAIASYENSLKPHYEYQRVVGMQNMHNYDFVERVDVRSESGFVIAKREGLVFGVIIDSAAEIKQSKAVFTVNRRVDTFSDFNQDAASEWELQAHGFKDLAPKNVESFTELAEITVDGAEQSVTQVEDYTATVKCK